ncbi:hypothetical protein Bbelb_156120 [Branchiostoma belcheri]|nr:hypothetical protein Bbelb_156120 [Branchiostoma belcheri]
MVRSMQVKSKIGHCSARSLASECRVEFSTGKRVPSQDSALEFQFWRSFSTGKKAFSNIEFLCGVSFRTGPRVSTPRAWRRLCCVCQQSCCAGGYRDRISAVFTCPDMRLIDPAPPNGFQTPRQDLIHASSFDSDPAGGFCSCRT